MILALPLENQVVGVLHTINDRLADAVYCDRLDILYGRDYYNEKILGLDFKVSAFSFFQTNVAAVENLYSYALSLLDDFTDKNVFDLYCGTGTITQVLAKKASKVTGVEIVEEAVEAAKAAAQLNGLDNCEFIAGDVFEVLDRLQDKPEVIRGRPSESRPFQRRHGQDHQLRREPDPVHLLQPEIPGKQPVLHAILWIRSQDRKTIR